MQKVVGSNPISRFFGLALASRWWCLGRQLAWVTSQGFRAGSTLGPRYWGEAFSLVDGPPVPPSPWHSRRVAETQGVYYRDKRGVEPVDDFVELLPDRRRPGRPARS